ncbi:beta-galactosidase [Methylobacterium sp. J-077]|uniref:beta-galactosidase n=1 Tax=Methylobacterium sp. J-077 TaxID=2836656 RepID=UPI001FB93D6A|nr:beta-galactosidase [Methylobacterium sp. J-077]MCJ2125044.1 beta-galactosidase [Methylobacterium sp. J-077]
MVIATSSVGAQVPQTILYGAAYYDEYTPVDRVDEDAKMMKAAGITVVRIAESTWGTLEPRPSVFDFSHIDRTLAAMNREGIKVIVGTPTYAVPTWLARQHPDILLQPGAYGPRQNMDITNPEYRAAAERIIVALIDHVKDDPAVIGYQVDNETKAFGTSGPNVQAAFVAAMKKKWSSLDDLNKAWGLDYWSNRINRWDDFPSVNASINASMTNAFQAFQRGLVTDFLAWQANLVRQHARPGQFVTQNFDLDWRGYSYGIQPEVDHWEAAKALDVAGIDIYHPSQEKLTGTEIAFGGDLARSMRGGQSYLLIETQAQGFPEWTPFPGQLRLQAFSHLASGAKMVGYWHWATTTNSFETYWRGLLTQDYKPNPVYDEAKTIGADLKRLGPKLADMKKKNRVALYVSNAALSAFDSFKINTHAFKGNADRQPVTYNEVVRGFYDALYRQNIEVDLISPASTVPFDQYKLIVVPALYAASDAEIAKLNDCAKAGAHVLYSFKSGFSDENTKVRFTGQPGGIAQAAGVTYELFTVPEGVSLVGDPFGVGAADNKARWWMEMLTPTTATVVARYQSPSWPAAAAVTRNSWGAGEVSYVGFMPTDALAEKILGDAAKRAGIEVPSVRWPIIVRGGTLTNGHPVRYVLNYSAAAQATPAMVNGTELLSGQAVKRGEPIGLPAWGVAIIEGDSATP